MTKTQEHLAGRLRDAHAVEQQSATMTGDAETRSVCEPKLREEPAMADWLSESWPAPAQKYLQHDMAELDANRYARQRGSAASIQPRKAS